MKKLSGIIIFLGLVAAVAAALFLYGRGYRVDIEDRSIKPTGILTIQSTPSDAKVFIDGEEKGTTNLDVSDLPPGEYNLKIVRTGFSTWERVVTIKKERVEPIKVVLFPLVPNLTSLTFTGVNKSYASPDGERIVFTVTAKDQAGIWSLDLSDRPLPIFFFESLTKIIADTKSVKYSSGEIEFSPDDKQILVTIAGQKPSFYLINMGEENPEPDTLKESEAKELTSSWQKQVASITKDKIETLGKEAVNFSNNLKNTKLSPDGKKYIGIDKNGAFVVFDSQPTPIPGVKSQTYTLEKAKNYIWYPDSQHLIVLNENNISISDVDGKNMTSIYSGSYESGFAMPWTDGSKVVILANFNVSQNNLPNLYSIDLR